MAIDFTEKAKRYQAIDEIIASGRKLKWNQIISELSQKYNIKTSRTSFFRDITDLQEKYNAPIDVDYESDGYFYTDAKYRLPRFYTDENAAKAARLLKTLIDMVKGNPLYKEAQEVFESLSIENHDLSLNSIKINKKPYNDRIIFVGAPNKDIPAETWRIIDRALNENLIITFDYQSVNDKKPSRRRVEPWQLIYDNGNWNLHAYDVIKHGRRRYTLSEMKNIQLTKELFKLPEDYDFRKMTMGSFGCMCHDSYLEYKIHLHGYAARYVQNRIWGENQKITSDRKNPGPDGSGIILSFKSNQLSSIERWVWQWADEAWPLSPKELVNNWKERRKKVNTVVIKTRSPL